MITTAIGDLFDADAEAFVNPVNCVGVMGRGLALQFKRRFPKNFAAYSFACARRAVRPGIVFIYKVGAPANPKFIVNFPTKRHWRDASRLDDIDSGLQALVQGIARCGIRSIAIPPLGCGLGGLRWTDVRPRIEAQLGPIAGLHTYIFDPPATTHR